MGIKILQKSPSAPRTHAEKIASKMVPNRIYSSRELHKLYSAKSPTQIAWILKNSTLFDIIKVPCYKGMRNTYRLKRGMIK